MTEYKTGQFAWCALCNAHVEMISVRDAAEMADASVRVIYSWAEARTIHYKLTPERSLLICVRSLPLNECATRRLAL